MRRRLTLLDKHNRYLLAILASIIGLICLLANAKGLFSFPGLLSLSLAMILAPLILITLRSKDCTGSSRVYSLVLLIVPILVVNHIFSITQGAPVGYQDVHRHMNVFSIVFDSNGHILFERVPAMSYNFVGLYILTSFFAQTMAVDITALAMVIPPLLNITIVILLYAIVARIHTHRVGILTAMLFGWESQVLIFGQEYRTQTLGTVFLFTALLVILIGMRLNETHGLFKCGLRAPFLLVILASAVATTSFVSSFFFVLAVLSILVVLGALARPLRMTKEAMLPIRQCALILTVFTAALLLYLVFISKGFDEIIGVFSSMFQDVAHSGNINLASFGRPIYGSLLDSLTIVLRLAFSLILIYYIYATLKEKNVAQLVIISALGALLFFSVVGTFMSMPLSPGRVYIITFALLALAVIFYIAQLNELVASRAKRLKPLFTLASTVIILLLVTVSFVKIPDYVIGDPEPIRGHEQIDDYVYWYSNEPQYAVAGFLTYSPNTMVNVRSVILNYNLMDVCRANNIHLTKAPLGSNNATLFVLEDSFRGDVFSGRSSFESYSSVEHLSKVYSNGDYISFATMGAA